MTKLPRLAGAAVAAFTILGLAGCSTGTDGRIDPSATGATARPPAPKPPGAQTYATATAAPAAEEESPTPDAVATFGQRGDWEDGLTGTVKAAKKATFGQYATTSGPGIKVTIQITNGSSAAVDLFPTLDVRLGTSGANAEQVYDEGCDSLTDLGRLAPGRNVSGTFCFAGTAKQVDVSLAPTMDHNALTWTGKVA